MFHQLHRIIRCSESDDVLEDPRVLYIETSLFEDEIVMIECRVCGGNNVRVLGKYRPYLDYECIVHDCVDCECRFVNRDEAVYEKLHSAPASSYSSHTELALKLQSYFSHGNIGALSDELCKTSKFKFVIDTISRRHNVTNLLEFGCSKGYLTSYFIAQEYVTVGVDLSSSAVEAATNLFGKHFVLPNSLEIEKHSPYDVVYHVGTIGCVESPITLTRYLLSLLKPGGLLLFNSPNLSACKETGDIWVSGTAPPDLVTLFMPAFWRRYFSELASVEVVCESADKYVRLKLLLNNILGRSQIPKATTTLLGTHHSTAPNLFVHKFLKDGAKANVRITANIFENLGILPQYSSEFGMYVTMTKK